MNTTETVSARADRLVRQEVHCCLSGMVATLAAGYGTVQSEGQRNVRACRDLDALTEQAFELAAPVLDYESAAREAGWIDDPEYPSTWIVGPDGTIAKTDPNHWQSACDLSGVDPHECEVYEHWAVSDWFADKLEAEGEKVDRDFAGLTVWARTTTGQMISADAVVERIAAQLIQDA